MVLKPTGPKKLSESRRAFLRRVKAGWGMYRHSKMGLIGLAIIIGFLILAIFAPLFTPYTPSFTAPSRDIIIADRYVQLLPNSTFNAPPCGITVVSGGSLGGGAKMVDIYLRDTAGEIFIYPITTTYKNGILHISLKSPITFHISKTITDIHPESTYIYSTSTPLTFVGHSSNTVFLWDHAFQHQKQIALNYTITQNSVFYNTNPYISSMAQYILYTVAGGENATVLFYSNMRLSGIGEIHFHSQAYIHLPSPIISQPLIYFNALHLNSSLIVFPTQQGLFAYAFNVSKFNQNYKILESVSFGKMLWHANYTVHGAHYTPASIIFANPYGDTIYGKDLINIATTNNHILAYYTVNGTLKYDKAFFIRAPTITGYKLNKIYPAGKSGTVLATALYQGSSIIARVNYHTGDVANNKTAYSLLIGKIIGTPTYIPSESRYLLNTNAGKVYIFDNSVKIKKTSNSEVFSVWGGKLKTSVSFLGNVLEINSVAGNYFGAILVNPTGAEQLYIRSTTGTDIAPLPPGKYPSGNTYILGTDQYGHDIWTWIVYGARMELALGVTAAVGAVLLGTFIGLIAGFFGGWIDAILMRLTDLFLSLPILVVMLILVSALGPHIQNIILVIIIFSWAGLTRIIRAQVLSLKARPYMDAAKVAGASTYRLMVVHLFPNVIPLTFFYMAIGVGGAILTEAALAFLGFGDPHAVTWGMMLAYIQLTGNVMTAPWWLLPPGIAITLISLAFYLVGRAFDEVVNPRLRRR